METEVLYYEKQRFNKYLLWGLFTLANGTFIFAIIDQLILGNQFGNNPINDRGLIGIAFLTFIITVLLLSMKLETNITKESIYVRFFPIQLKYREYQWSDIKQVSLRQYNPLWEYGGWGIRGFVNNRALNMSGNKGIQLVFHNGRKLLIGTNRYEEVEQVLKNLEIGI